MNATSHTVTDEEPVVQTVAEPLQKILQKAARIVPQSPQERVPRTVPFRPAHRQPLASLTILDDGSREEGETIRIRKPSLIIGREKGDVTIPFDNDLSARHAELRCEFHNGRYRWYLIDLSSSNGTFLRAYRATLAKEWEMILGSRRYLFELPDREESEIHERARETNLYRAPRRTQREPFVPRLIEIGTEEPNERVYFLGGTKIFLGRDQQTCQIAIPDDPYLSPRHARFSQDRRGCWMIEDRKSSNGIWIRVKRMLLHQPAEFQLGQQRFSFRPALS